MNCAKVASVINDWLIQQLVNSVKKGFVIGVSGGVDSGLVSTLCAKTGKPTICVSMPIHQAQDQVNRAAIHMTWLSTRFKNVTVKTADLTTAFKYMCKIDFSELACINIRSRLRMTTLYGYANTFDHLVVGTGNKVEDYGIGFFTKFGDGGVDSSPIGSLYKSEVRELAKHLGVSKEIYNAVPTDGLWSDNRSDEQQIGATYDELEWAMENYPKWCQGKIENFTDRQKEVMEIYMMRHEGSKHKMRMPPICEITEDMKI